MPFTPSERERFVVVLQSRGWTLEKDTLWSPSRGLYFNDSHFQDWSPAEMRDVFTRRGDRIQKSAFDGWERSVGEHRDVCSAAAEVLGA
jgi:hypothetical protein